MGRSQGKNKVPGKRAQTRASLKSAPELSGQSVILGIEDEMLVFYDRATNQVVLKEVQVGHDYSSEHEVDSDQLSQIEYNLIEQLKSRLKAGEDVSANDLTTEVGLEFSTGMSFDRLDQTWSTEDISIDSYLDVPEDGLTEIEENPGALLKRLDSKESKEVLETISAKANQSEADAIAEDEFYRKLEAEKAPEETDAYWEQQEKEYEESLEIYGADMAKEDGKDYNKLSSKEQKRYRELAHEHLATEEEPGPRYE